MFKGLKPKKPYDEEEIIKSKRNMSDSNQILFTLNKRLEFMPK